MNNNDRKFGGRLIDIVLITTIATLTVLIILFTTTTNEYKFQNVSASNQPPVSQSDSVDSNLPDISSSVIQQIQNTTIDGIRIVNETLKDNIKPYTIQYFKTNFESVNTVINKYISDSKNQYENIVRLKNTVDKNASTPNLLNNLNIKVEMYPHKEKYLSFVFIKNVAVKSNLYDTTIYTLFLNTETGELIDLQQILNDDEKSLTSLSEKVRTTLLNNQTYHKFINQEVLNKVTVPEWVYFQRFIIKNDALIFYFNKGEIADGRIGIPTASIPLSSIDSILSKKFKTGITDDSATSTPPSQTPPPPKVESSGKRVALTFDDGPHPTVTKNILNILDKYNAKATFFIVGNRVEKNADIIKDAFERGHEIGNHTWNHANLTKLSSNQIAEQINSTNKAIKNVIGQNPTVFRPPYGAKNNQVSNAFDLPVIMWTIDTLDWKYRDASKLLPMVKKNMHNNAIILMHDIHSSTGDGLESVLKYLQAEGYEFVTVSELLEYK